MTNKLRFEFFLYWNVFSTDIKGKVNLTVCYFFSYIY